MPKPTDTKSRDLRIGILGSRIVTDVHTMNISRRKEEKMLAASDNSIEILVVILVKGGL